MSQYNQAKGHPPKPGNHAVAPRQPSSREVNAQTPAGALWLTPLQGSHVQAAPKIGSDTTEGAERGPRSGPVGKPSASREL